MTDANISENILKDQSQSLKGTKTLTTEFIDIANPKLLEEASNKQKEKENVATTQIDLIRAGIPTVSRVTPTSNREKDIVKDYFLNDQKKYYNVIDDNGMMLSVSPLITGDVQKDELNRLNNNPKLENTVEVKIPIKNADGVSDTYTYFWNVGEVWNKEKGVFEKIGRTEEEINKGAKEIVKNAYERLYTKDIPPPLFNSTPEQGLKFKDLGANIEAEVDDFNTVKGYGGDVAFELGKRDLFGKYASGLVDFVVGKGLAPIASNIVFNVFRETLELGYGKSRYFENKEEFDSIIETAYSFKNDAVDALTVGDAWAVTAQNLYAKDEKELAEGIVPRTTENWQAFIEGKNDYFLIRGGQELVQTANINKATIKAMDFFGVGPKDAKKFFDELAGLKAIDKKRQPYLKETGYDFYRKERVANAKADGTKVPSNAKLKKEYDSMADSNRSHYVNKALGTYLQNKLGIDGGGSFFKSTNMLLTQNKYDVGGNLRGYYKGENIFTISESIGYSVSGELISDSPFLNTMVALGSGFGGLKYSTSDYARRIRDPKQNVLQKGIKTVLNSVVEGSPYTLLDGLLYMVDPISKNFTFLKSRGLGGGQALKESEFRGRVQRLKEIDEANNIKPRSDQYYADKALTEYGVEMPNKGTDFNYFLMVAGAAKQTGNVEKLITENQKEFKFLEDLAEGINKVTDPVVKERVIQSLREFKTLQSEITRLKETMKVNLKEGEIHPADQLSTALFNILPLYTTASAVRTMVQNAQAGYLKMINLSEAELLFQNAQTQFLAASNMIQDIVNKTRGGEVGKTIENTVSNVQKFITEEGKILQTAKDELNTMVTVIEKFMNIDTFTLNKTPLDNLEANLQQRADDLSMDEIINGDGEIGESIKAIKEARNRVHRKTISLIGNLSSDFDTVGKKSRQVVFEEIMNDKAYDLILDGNIIYGSVYRKLKGVNVQGEDVDSLILNFRSLTKIEDSSDYYTKNINYNIKAKALRSLNTSLKPYGTQLRDRLKTLAEGDLDQVQDAIQDLGFQGNMYNEADLYAFYVSNVKKLEKGEDDFLDVFKDVYDDYALSAETLIHMDRSVSNRKFILDKKEIRSPEQDVELQNINSLRGNIMNIFQTKNNIPADILNEFPIAKERYKNYVGIPKHNTIFTPKVERMDYVQNEDEMIETYDMIRDMKVKKKKVVDEKFTEKRYAKGKGPNDILYNIGEKLSSGNPSDIEYVYQQTLLRFGTEATGTTKVVDASGKETATRTRVIANAVDAERVNIILNQSIQSYVEGALQKAMKKYDPESDGDLPQAAKDIMKSILPNGALYKSMRALEKKSIIKEGSNVWARKLDANGEPVMDNSGEWLRSRQTGTLSRVEYNMNKPVINFGATERKLEMKLQTIYKDNEKVKLLIADANTAMEKAKQRVGSAVNQKILNDETNYRGMAEFFQELNFSKQVDVDPDKLSEALLSDRTGGNIKRLKEFLKGEAKNKKYYKITKRRDRVIKTVMSKVEAEKEIDEFVDNLVLRFLSKNVLVPANEVSGDAPKFKMNKNLADRINPLSKRQFFADGEDGRSFIEEINKVPDLNKLLEADDEYGQIFRTILPGDQYDKIYAIAKKLSYDRKLLDEAAGVLGNAPTPISIAMVMQRAFNLARGMVSVRWVGADAMLRAARLGNADIMRAVLTTRVPVQTGSDFQITAVDVLHDMLVNGNFSKKNAISMRNILPQMLQNAEVTFETEEGPNAQSYSDAIGRGIEAVLPLVDDISRIPNVNVFQPFVPRFEQRKPRSTDDRPRIDVEMEDIGLGRTTKGRVKREEPPRRVIRDAKQTDAATRRKEDRNKKRIKADTISAADIIKDLNI